MNEISKKSSSLLAAGLILIVVLQLATFYYVRRKFKQLGPMRQRIVRIESRLANMQNSGASGKTALPSGEQGQPLNAKH